MEKMKLNYTFGIGRWRFQLFVNSYILSKVRTQGIYDICEDGRHVVFLDYDRFKLEWLENEIHYLQNKFKLGDFIILESSENSYHAVCFDKLHPREHQKVIDQSNCDEAFKNAPRWDYGSRVLRAFPKGNTQKPKYMKIIQSIYNDNREKSKAHHKFFRLNYDIGDLRHQKLDNSVKVYLIDYPTRKGI